MNELNNNIISENSYEKVTEYIQSYILKTLNKQCNYIKHCLEHNWEDAGGVIFTLQRIGYLGDMSNIANMSDMEELILSKNMHQDIFVYDEIYTYLTIKTKSLESEFRDKGCLVLYNIRERVFENTVEGISIHQDDIFTQDIEKQVREKIIELINLMRGLCLTRKEKKQAYEIMENTRDK